MKSITADKAALRRQVRAYGRALSPEARRASDDALLSRFLSLPQVAAADTLLLYHGMGAEPDTARLIPPLLELGKRLALPRCLPEHLSAKIDKAAIQTPAIFRLLQSQGGIPERDMFNTYNMGVGMTVIVSKEDADRARSSLSAENCSAYVIGEITEGGERVNLC